MNWRTGIWRLLWPFRSWARKGLEVGDRFPDFSLLDPDGRRYSLSDNPAGIPTVLWLTNFCEDCLSKVPLLEELRRKEPGRIRILAVSLLGADETLPRRVSALCGFPILIDPDDIVGNRLGLPHPPGTCPLHNLFILDQRRGILFRHHLSALKPEAFRAAWREHIPQGGEPN